MPKGANEDPTGVEAGGHSLCAFCLGDVNPVHRYLSHIHQALLADDDNAEEEEDDDSVKRKKTSILLYRDFESLVNL